MIFRHPWPGTTSSGNSKGEKNVNGIPVGRSCSLGLLGECDRIDRDGFSHMPYPIRGNRRRAGHPPSSHRTVRTAHQVIFIHSSTANQCFSLSPECVYKPCVSNHAFVRRFLLHVLPSAFVKIRYYGIFANPVRRKKIEIIRQSLKNRLDSLRISIVIFTSWKDLFKNLTGDDPDLCLHCAIGKMVLATPIPATCRPP